MPPRPTPTAILAARGSWRANTRPNEPQLPIVANIEAPGDLSDRALQVWDTMASALMSSGLLTVVDIPAFARLCRVYVAWSDAMSAVEASPDRTTVLTLAKLDEMLRKLEANFGLTPADRTGIAVSAPDNGEDDFFAVR